MKLPKLFQVMLFTLVFGIGMASLLSYYKFKSSLAETVRGRMVVVATDVQDAISQSMKLGLQLSAMESLPNLLRRDKEADPLITSLDVADANGNILVSTNPGNARQTIPSAWQKIGHTTKSGAWKTVNEASGDHVVGMTIYNSYNLPVGYLTVQYSSAQLESQAVIFRDELLISTGILLVCCVVLCAILLWLASRTNSAGEGKLWVVVAPIMFVLLVGLSTMSWQTVPMFENRLLPELSNKAATVARTEAALISKAASLGVLPTQLVGVESTFRQDLEESREFIAIALLDTKHNVLASAGKSDDAAQGASAVIQPIEYEGNVIGKVRIRLDPEFAQRLVREVGMDLIVVLVVALVFTVEVLNFAIAGKGSVSQARAPYLAIRAPAFVFFLSEEMLRSFLPAFASQMQLVDVGLSWQVVAGLPLMAFMLVVALGQPVLGSISDRFGVRRTLITGALLSSIGLVGAAFSGSIILLLLCRVIGAIGYGAVFVSAQGFILNHSSDKDRTKGFAIFVGSIMAAAICGTSLGGIMADNVGMRNTIVLAGLLSVFSIVFMLRLPADQVSDAVEPAAKAPGGKYLSLLRNTRFAALCVFAGIPAKLLLSGICFYLLPLYVISVGSNQAMSGRILMIYAVLVVLIMPFAARTADKKSKHRLFVGAGLLISAIGGCLVFWLSSLWVAVALSISIGIGQAFSIASQSTLVGNLAQEEANIFGQGAIYGVYRLIERLGNALGPLVAAVLLTALGFEKTFIAFSGFAVFCALMFAIIVGRGTDRRVVAPVTSESF